MLRRHGVRAPTQTAAELAKLSARDWPTWSVGRGELSAHGERGEKILGGYFRSLYAAEGLISPKACPADDVVLVWADGADQRTRASGQAWLEGMSAGCALKAHYAPLDSRDPLFHPADADCPLDPALAAQSVRRRVGGNLDELGAGYHEALTATARILRDPGLLGVHNDLQIRGRQLQVEGPLSTAATAAEIFLLEYEEGLPAGQVGWGEAASVPRLAVLLPAHNVYSDLLRRDPYIAAHNGALLANRLAQALGGPMRLLAFVGHDTNLANLAALIDTSWQLPGQPDFTPPGGTLTFEVWRAADGGELVRVIFFYQTPEQLRELQTLDVQHPPGARLVAIPGCQRASENLCTLQELSSLLQRAYAQACQK